MVSLPDVEEDFTADVTGYVVGLEAMIDAAERARDANYELLVSLGALQAGQDAAARGASVDAAAQAYLAEQQGNAARTGAEAAAANTAVAESEGNAARGAAEQAAATDLSSAAQAEAAKTAYLLAMAQRMQANTARDAAGSTVVAGAAAATATGFWARWGTVIHWVVAGGSEFLAVFIPATVAAGAAAAVMAEGVQNATVHLEAMYTAQEATANVFHTTTGQMLGLTDALQKAQTAADPRVYELLGAGINIASKDSGQFVRMGTEVLNILDQFAAKVTGELTGALGGQLHGLLSGGAHDLAGLGAVLGNTGHAVISLASDMPGLAEVLLAVLDGATRLLSVLSGMPGVIITVAMGMEEFNRWGGMVSSVLGRMTGASTQATGAWYNLWGNALIVSQNFARVALTGFANVASGLGSLMMNVGAFSSRFAASMMAAGTAEQVVGEEGVVAAGETTALQDVLYTTGAAAQVAGAEMIAAGAEVDVFAAQVEAASAAITPLEALLAVAAAVGLGIFIDKVVTAKSAVQQWAAAMNQALASTSDLQLVPRIASDIANTNVKMTQTQQQFTQAVAASNNQASQTASRLTGASAAAYGAALNMQTLTQEHQHLASAMQTVLTGAGMLARMYGTTFTGALALAQGAGVNLTQSLQGNSQAVVDARLQIANYVAGMGAMGESSTAVGHDVTLLGISSALTATKVSQLNQAVDQFVSGVTGGTSALGGMAESINNIGKVTITSANALQGYNATAGLTMAQSAQAMTNFGQIGSQVWQNFDSALTGSGEQLADWFRTAGAEGAVSSAQLTSAMQAIVAQFIPFAAKSAVAQQELVGFAQAQGLNVTKFSQLQAMFGSAGAATRALDSDVSHATAGMANMNQVAQALGSSIGTDVVGAMNNARIAASGLTGAAQNMSEAWNNAHQVNNQVVQGFAQTYRALLSVYGNTNLARQAADAYAQELGLNAQQINQLNGIIAAYSNNLNHIPRNVTTELTVTGNITPSAIAALQAAGVPQTTIAHVHGQSGYQAGAAYVPPGTAWVGEHGPELVRFSGGQEVLPAWQSRATPGGPGGGGGSGVTHTHIYIDGHEVFTAIQDQTYSYNRRNGLATTGSLAPPG